MRVCIAGFLALGGCYSGLAIDAEESGAETAASGDATGGQDDGSDSGGTGDPTDPESLCAIPQPGAAPLRRLTRTEYNNTVRDLLGDTTRPADGFVGEQIIGGFDNNAQGGSMSRLAAEQYEAAAEVLATEAVADLPGLLGCDPAAQGSGCVEDFVRDFVFRAYRRPPSEGEVDRLVQFYDEEAAVADPQTAMRMLLTAVLQSPFFLYRVEEGRPELEHHGAIPLTDYEIATRLAYLLWNSMPDEALFEAASNGELSTPEQIATQAERMLTDDKAISVLTDFHEQWLMTRSGLPSELADIEHLVREEARTFIRGVVLEEDGLLSTLLDADFTYLNAELAGHYGLDTTGLGEGFDRVELDPQRRAGLLTQALILSVNAEEHETSPIKRGRFVREQLLCQPLPPPPPDVMVEPPDPDPNKTTRERYAEHRENPACAGCHDLIDPIGFAFEHYDHFGRWRDEENGLPIDASGEIVSASEESLNVEFDGAVELAGLLADSDQVRDCAVDNWFRYAYGRMETADDECTVDHLSTTFIESGGDVQTLLLELTQTDAFRFRPAL